MIKERTFAQNDCHILLLFFIMNLSLLTTLYTSNVSVPEQTFPQNSVQAKFKVYIATGGTFETVSFTKKTEQNMLLKKVLPQ